MWGDPAITRYIGGRPSAPDEAWARLLRYIGHWSALGFGYWAVEEKASGAFVGELGFADFKRAGLASFRDKPELGWVIVADRQGRGYASEALAAAVAWGDRHLNVAETVAMIDPGNAASLRLAAKLGYREYARADYKGAPSILLSRQVPRS